MTPLTPHSLGELIVPAVAPAVATAPVLPPPASVAAARVPASADFHPVPPGSIPDAAPLSVVASAGHVDSGFYGLMAKIPLLGRVVGR
ncbi:MAG: hypothetical protein ACREQX_11840 [Candidatus Binataceae bacterium]